MDSNEVAYFYKIERYLLIFFSFSFSLMIKKNHILTPKNAPLRKLEVKRRCIPTSYQNTVHVMCILQFAILFQLYNYSVTKFVSFIEDFGRSDLRSNS